MPKVQETNGQIVFIEEVPDGVKIILTIVGLIPIFLVPYELLIRPGWSEFSLYLVIPILISIGAIFLGGFFVVGGLFGLNKRIEIIKKSRTINYSYSSAIMPYRKQTFLFNDIAKVSIITHDWTDGPSTYSLQFIFHNGQEITTGSFEKRIEAEQSLMRVEDIFR